MSFLGDMNLMFGEQKNKLAHYLISTSYLEIFNAGQILNDLYGWARIFERADNLYDPLRELINASGVEIESLIP